jgi:ankyrin repeat protein
MSSEIINPPENPAELAHDGKLTVQDVQHLTKEKLETDKYLRCNVLYHVSAYCPTEVVEAVLDKGVHIDGLSGSDWTALMVASYDGKEETVKLLVKRGANVNLVNDNGWTCLHCAGYSGASPGIITTLINAGCDPKAKTNEGTTPVDLANQYFHPETARLIEQFYQPPTKSANFLV